MVTQKCVSRAKPQIRNRNQSCQRIMRRGAATEAPGSRPTTNPCRLLAGSRGYDALPEFWVESSMPRIPLKTKKKMGLRMQSPASHQPRSPDLRCKCPHL